MSSVTVDGQNGSAAGTLECFSIVNDGFIMGSFGNGTKQPRSGR